MTCGGGGFTDCEISEERQVEQELLDREQPELRRRRQSIRRDTAADREIGPQRPTRETCEKNVIITKQLTEAQLAGEDAEERISNPAAA